MLVNYLKLKNISFRGRAIALSAVGGVFLCLVLFSIWQQYFADTLRQYVPGDAIFYAHFSLPTIKNSEQFNNLLVQVLQDNGLGDFNLSYLGREAAVVGRQSDGRLQYGVILRTASPKQLRSFLIARNLNYDFLDSRRAVVASPELAGLFIKNRDNRVARTIGRKFSLFNSLSVYAAPDFVNSLDDTSAKMAHALLADADGKLFLNFQIKRAGLKIFPDRQAAARSGGSTYSVARPDQIIDADIVLLTDNIQALLSAWASELPAVFPADDSAGEASRLNHYLNTTLFIAGNGGRNFFHDGLFFIAKKNDKNIGWFFGDYDFYFGTKATAENIQALEMMAKTIMARRYPAIKNVYLSDGTRVKELLPDPDRLAFVARNGAKTLSSPDGDFQLKYRTDGDVVIADNGGALGAEAQFVDSALRSRDNYLKIKIDLLPRSGFWRYLTGYDYVEISNKKSIFIQ